MEERLLGQGLVRLSGCGDNTMLGTTTIVPAALPQVNSELPPVDRYLRVAHCTLATRRKR